MKELKNLCLDLMKNQTFDTLGVAVLNFVDHSVDSLEITKKKCVESFPRHYFDLASLTKPLTLSLTYLAKPELFDESMLLLLEHRAGLPSGGRLSRDNWKEEILRYQVKKSDTLYSDYSALRLMLELEYKLSKSLKDVCEPFYDEELKHWEDLTVDDMCVTTGFRRGQIIEGQVHDNNAFFLGGFLPHAGLFSTVNGLAKTLFNIDKKLSLLNKVDDFYKQKQGRFVRGFDTVENFESTLAGKGCSEKTFGHMGFTGTSFWIDLAKKRGVIILTNGTQNFWYARQRLNHLRKSIGSYVWTM